MPTDRTPGLLAIGAAGLCGAIIPVQSRVNGELSVDLGSLPAALVSFGTGLLALSMLLLVPAFRRQVVKVPAALRSGQLRWWHLIGGFGGALFVASQTYAVPVIGVTAFLIAAIGGATVSALVVDRVGLGPAPPQRLTPARLVAAALAVAGVAVAATDPSRSGAGSVVGWALLLPIVAVFLAGAGSSAQQAVNARVSRAAGAPLVSGLANFVTGTALLVLLTIPAVAFADGWTGSLAAPWWAWTGGLMGVAFIVLAAFSVSHLPVLTFALVTVTVQLAVGLVLDLFQPATRAALGPQVLAGVMITLIAAVLSALAARAARSARTGQHAR